MKMALSAVYTCIQGHYYICHFVEPHGPIENELVWQLYEESFGRNETHFPQYYGPFQDLETLTKFCFKICDESRSEQINLVSLEEFNQLLESSPNINSLKEKLPELGNVMQNPDAAAKKGLFGKLFN